LARALRGEPEPLAPSLTRISKRFPRFQNIAEFDHVGNLNFSTSEDALRKLFVAFGPVKRVKIMMDDYTGKSRGFGFVEANAEDGEKRSLP